MYADGWKKYPTPKPAFECFIAFLYGARKQYLNDINRTTWTILIHMKLTITSQLAYVPSSSLTKS